MDPKEDCAMKELIDALRLVDRNKVAAILSVLPGAGHIYKHHYLSGFTILVAGNALMVFAAVLMTLGTFGVSLLLVPVVYFAAVAYAAYSLPDWHGRHHFLHPWRPGLAHDGP
jgi:hypothetical protein